MIRCLIGTVQDTGDAHVVLNVSGVGYLVHVSVAGSSFAIDASVTLYTHLAVRETALDLYGFATRDELDIFELLLTLPKIGPKSALQILAQADITLLKEAVAQEDASYLSKMSGIGKKTAEKIVVGLKDSFNKRGYSELASSTNTTATWQQEAIDALVSLGYPQKDARDAVQNLPPEIADTNTALTTALRSLSS